MSMRLAADNAVDAHGAVGSMPELSGSSYLKKH